MGEIRTVKISQIRENPIALRAVNREHEGYLGLVDSMRVQGFFGAITGREKSDPDSGESYIELLDGLHRFSAAMDAGLTEVNVDIKSLDDAEALELQIMANVHKVETRPVEYSNQLRRLLNAHPLMTEIELANKLGKSPSWISARLGLNKFEGKVAELINEGKIPLSNAYPLSKLPPEEVGNFVDRAMTESPEKFIPACQARIKEIREANRKGKDAAPAVFVPAQYAQKLSDLKSELETCKIGQALMSELGISEPTEVWRLAIQWVLHADAKSVEVQQAEDDTRRAAKKAAAEKRKAERKAKTLDKKKAAYEEAEKAAVAVSDGE